MPPDLSPRSTLREQGKNTKVRVGSRNKEETAAGGCKPAHREQRRRPLLLGTQEASSKKLNKHGCLSGGQEAGSNKDSGRNPQHGGRREDMRDRAHPLRKG